VLDQFLDVFETPSELPPGGYVITKFHSYQEQHQYLLGPTDMLQPSRMKRRNKSRKCYKLDSFNQAQALSIHLCCWSKRKMDLGGFA
jgi:hypothetical protein